jgi:hypothetical protein
MEKMESFNLDWVFLKASWEEAETGTKGEGRKNLQGVP